MARKTVQEKIVNVKVNPRYDASFKDTEEVLRLYKEPFKMFHVAFRYGYLQGAKAAKKELGGAKA